MTTTTIPPRPMIVKHNGIQSVPLFRNAIGYILKGRRYLYDGDNYQEMRAGDLFCLSVGTHYIEDIPEENRPFEQIVFYYDTPQLNKILHCLNLNYHLPIHNDHDCERCRNRQNVVYPAWNVIKHFFHSVNQYLKEDLFNGDQAAENLIMTQLVYLLTREDNCCLNGRILNSIDIKSADFEQIIHQHIFLDIPIEELAEKCNRSLTAFKKDFKRHFHDSPHRWFVRQRLMKARLQLISSGKSVSEIGVECAFPNTSHFIKLFKKEFEDTPVAYRKKARTMAAARRAEALEEPPADPQPARSKKGRTV